MSRQQLVFIHIVWSIISFFEFFWIFFFEFFEFFEFFLNFLNFFLNFLWIFFEFFLNFFRIFFEFFLNLLWIYYFWFALNFLFLICFEFLVTCFTSTYSTKFICNCSLVIFLDCFDYFWFALNFRKVFFLVSEGVLLNVAFGMFNKVECDSCNQSLVVWCLLCEFDLNQ